MRYISISYPSNFTGLDNAAELDNSNIIILLKMNCISMVTE